PILVQLLAEDSAHKAGLFISARARHHHKRCDQMRRICQRRQVGGDAHGRSAKHPDPTVRPRLFGDPFDGVVTVRLVIRERAIFAFALERPTTILGHKSKSTPRPRTVQTRLRSFAVRSAHQHYRPRPFTFGQIDNRRELNAVAHRRHLLAWLRRLTGGGWSGRSSLLRECRAKRPERENDNESRDEKTFPQNTPPLPFIHSADDVA